MVKAQRLQQKIETREVAHLDDGSIAQESKIEILRAQRAAQRCGRFGVQDTTRENEGVDEEDPHNSIYDGIRLEPFNMRREMAEGHFDEGGFYILNKDEEKEVTDAWLDTVDKASKAATFQKIEKQQQIGQVAASRLSALCRNLGEPEEEEADEKEVESEKATDNQPKCDEKEEEEPENPEEEIAILEALIGELLPLEKPAEALARLARAGVASKSVDKQAGPLKMRARIRKERAKDALQAGQVAKESVACEAEGSKPSKRRFSEFGYEEEEQDGEPKKGTESVAADRSVADSAAIAAAAERAAAKEHAEVEAAKAFAAEMRLTRQTLHAALEEEDGPEASAMLNNHTAEQTRADRVPAAATDAASEEPEAEVARQQRKRKADSDDSERERKRKIERLTDLCDRLLQRGVLVYDSTRELLAIEVRERKGEQLRKEETQAGDANSSGLGAAGGAGGAEAEALASSAGPTAPATGGNSAESAASATSVGDAVGQNAAVGSILYVNKRYRPADGQTVATALEGDAAAKATFLALVQPEGHTDNADATGEATSAVASSSVYLWQYRWLASPDQVHGPFDSVTMQGWVNQACFSEERAAEVRQCDDKNVEQEQCWHRWDAVDFELYI